MAAPLLCAVIDGLASHERSSDFAWRKKAGESCKELHCDTVLIRTENINAYNNKLREEAGIVLTKQREEVLVL